MSITLQTVVNANMGTVTSASLIKWKPHSNWILYACLLIVTVVLVALILTFSLRQEQETKECSEAPPGNRNLPKRKEDDRFLVLCDDRANSAEAEVWECDANNEWMLIRNDSCECYEEPPEVKPPKMSNWDGTGSLDIGQKVKYYCNPADEKMDVVYEVRECSNEKTWNVIAENTTSGCNETEAVCKGDPPAAEHDIVRVWNQVNYRVGTLIPYYCNNNTNSRLQKTVVCNMYRLWKVVHDGMCDCISDPPTPTVGIHLLWDNDTSVGAVAMYMCGVDYFSTVLLTYLCSSDGKWKMVYRSACRMDSAVSRCVPPPHYELIEGDKGSGYLRNMTQIGAVIKYMCNFGRHIEKTMICDQDKTWRIIFQGTCNLYCQDDLVKTQLDITRVSPFKSINNMIGHGVTDMCASSKEEVTLAPVYQTWVCTNESKWTAVVQNTCQNQLTTIKCDADPPVPEGRDQYFRVWKFSARTLGSDIHYTCLADNMDTLAASYRCSDWGKWVKVNSSTCRCPSPDLPPQNWFDQEVQNSNFFVGTDIKVYCSKIRPSPIYQTQHCGGDLKWHIIPGCDCECPNPPKGEYPVTLQTKLHGNEKFYIGQGNVTYTCYEQDTSQITLKLMCVAELLPGDEEAFDIVWKDTLKAACPIVAYECAMNPPAPPIKINWDWDYNTRTIGTIVLYYCYGDGSRVWSTMLCNKHGLWEPRSLTQSCGCIAQPPPPSKNILRVWQGPDLSFGKVVHYECTQTPDYRVLRTLTCDGSGVWRTIFRGSCRKPDHSECTENYPDLWSINKTRYVLYPDNNKANYSGATITVYCEPPSKLVQNYTVAVRKLYVCDAYTKRWILAVEGRCDCDEPDMDMTIDGYKPTVMWEGFISVGSIVKYLCPQLGKGRVARRIYQCDSGTWSVIYEGACACFGYPERPHKRSLRVWNYENAVGQDVTYLCSSQPNAPVEIVYTCYSSGQWKVNKNKDSNDCYCEHPPLPPQPAASNWDGLVSHMGTIVSYRCTSKKNSSLIATVRCSVSREWIVMSIYNWSLVDRESLKMLRHRSRHHYANIQPGAQARYSKFDLGEFSSRCKDLLIPGFPFLTKFWNAILTCRCDCIDDPPQLKYPITDNWIATNRKRSQGTAVWYWCTEEQRLPVRMVLVCSEDRMWRLQETVVSCDCPQSLPGEESYRGYPIAKESTGPPHHVGTRVYYRCNHNPMAPILAIFECIYWHDIGQGGEWMKIVASGKESCTCPSSLPPVPVRFPRLVPIYEYVHGNSDTLANWIGSRIHYMCGTHHKSGRYHTVECDVDGYWKTVNFEGKCVECDEDPPTGPGIRNWDGSKVLGTIVVYQCSRSIPGPHLMDWQCSPDTRKWVQIFNGTCECTLLPEVLPPPLTIQADWRHSGSRKIGKSYKVTCATDYGSPLIDIMYCTDRGLWARSGNESWVDLKHTYCRCTAPPILRPLVGFFDFGNGTQELDLEIGEDYRCARQATSSCSKGGFESSFDDRQSTGENRTTYFYIEDIVNYRCTREPYSPIRKQFICSGQKVWKVQIDNKNICRCDLDPPAAIGKEFLDWSGNNSMTTIANYRCSIHSPIVKYSRICSGKGLWERNGTLDKSCNCSDNFPKPPESLAGQLGNATLFWDGSLEVLSTIRYHCNSNPMSPLLVEFTCNQSNMEMDWFMTKPNVSSGFVLQESFWTSHFSEICSCPQIPPIPADSSIYLEGARHRTIGSVVTLQCSADPASGFLEKYYCNYNLVWLSIETENASDCSCVEDPPPAPKGDIATREWDGNRFIGINVTYLCRDYPEAIFQMVQCTPSKRWEYVLPPNPDGSCLCLQPPNLGQPYRMDWPGNDSKIGGRVSYYCQSNISTSPILYNALYREYECSKSRSWDLVQENPCECPENLPEASIESLVLHVEPKLNRTPGSEVAAHCTADILSPSIYVFECQSNLKWKVKSTLQNLITEHCTCRETPPEARYPHNREWSGSLLMGSNVTYYCTEDYTSSIYLTLTCGTDHEWHRSSESTDYYLIYSTCFCPPPPTTPPRVGLTLFRPLTTVLGSQYTVRCGPTAKHPLYARYTCLNSRRWNISELTPCICYDPPTRVTENRLFFDRPYSYTHAGQSIHVYCSALPDSPFLGEYLCSDMLTWVLITPQKKFNEATCECEMPPVDGTSTVPVGKPYIIGDNVYEWCKPNKTKMVATWTCMQNRTWSHQGTLKPEKCICSKKPPEPNVTGFVIEGGTVQNYITHQVIYRCSTFEQSSIAMSIRCSEDNEWTIIIPERDCTCPLEKLPLIEKPFSVNTSMPNRMGLVLPVQCSVEEGSPIFQYLRCNNDKSWSYLLAGDIKRLATGHCECGTLPTRDETMKQGVVWSGDYLVGTPVHYTCKVVPEVVFQSYVCRFVKKSEGFEWTSTTHGTCFCETPPLTDPDYVRQINTDLGSTTEVMCNNLVDAPVKFKYECTSVPATCDSNETTLPCFTVFWNQSEMLHSCECNSYPPAVHPFHLSISHSLGFIPKPPELRMPHKPYFGTRAFYLCSEHENGIIIQVLRCGINDEWEVESGVDRLNSDACDCPNEFPPVEAPKEILVQGKNWKRSMGTNYPIICHKYYPHLISGNVTCGMDRQWIIKEAGENCSCNISNIPLFDSPLKIIFDHQGISSSAMVGAEYRVVCHTEKHDLPHGTLRCSGSKTWILTIEEACMCSDDPPLPPSADLAVSQWNLIRLVGTIVEYTCHKSRHSPVVQRAECVRKQKLSEAYWQFQDYDNWERVRQLCYCPTPPPPAVRPLILVWNMRRRMGTVVQYECVKGIIHYEMTCDIYRKWVRSRDVHPCECSEDIPNLSPAIPIYTSSRVEAKVHYMCTASPMDGMYRIYKCNTSFQWDQIVEFSCKCRKKPEEPPSAIYMEVMYYYDPDANGFYVGSSIKYKCSLRSESVVIREIKCTNSDIGQEKIWRILSERRAVPTTLKTGTWQELIQENCLCTADPPEPLYNIGWDWNYEPKHENGVVKYYCSVAASLIPNYASIFKTVAQAVCLPDKTWSLEMVQPSWQEIVQYHCVCNKPYTLPISGVMASWIGATNRVSSIITYWCKPDQFYSKLTCLDNKTWVEFEKGACDQYFCAATVNEATKCLSPYLTPSTVVDAKAKCSEHNQTLVAILTKQMNQQVLGCVSPTDYTCPLIGFYIAALYNDVRKQWEFDINIPITGYTNWKRQRLPGEDCAVIDSRGFWVPVKCSKKLCFICSYEAYNNTFLACQPRKSAQVLIN